LKPVNVGLLGIGTVGSGTWSVLKRNASEIERRAGRGIRITRVADKDRQYVFRVADAATKPEIKAAVELLFKTKVDSVTVSRVKGKKKRFGRFMGRRGNWKKAYVRLAAGQEINFGATE